MKKIVFILLTAASPALAQQYNRSGSGYDDGQFASGTYTDGTGWQEQRDKFGSTYNDSAGRSCTTSAFNGYSTTTCNR